MTTSLCCPSACMAHRAKRLARRGKRSILDFRTMRSRISQNGRKRREESDQLLGKVDWGRFSPMPGDSHSPQVHRVTLRNPYIALVDDDASVRTALARLLRLADFEVSAFPSGEAFLAALDARHPDCMILDVHMAGLSGLNVQARLRAAHIKIPVVFMTAADDLALDQLVQEAGGARLLRKPFSNAELLHAIGAALRFKPSDVS